MEGPDRLIVRRSLDARGRVIGRLSSQLFTALVEAGRLKQLGTYEPTRYVWNGPALDRAATAPVSIKAFVDVHTQQAARTLLGHILHVLSNKEEADTLRRVSEWFYQDHVWEAEAGSIAGMNWQGLALGDRIDRSRRSSDEGQGDPIFRAKAKARLKQVRARFSERAYNELYALILSEHGRKHYAATFAFTEHEAERRAVDLMRRLSWFYEKDVAPPEMLASLSGVSAAAR